ncbi:hypothetical protein EDB84DRAFT_1438638 [Lactarius hengduanensis]|nr:hypothetical protein EDB84DRAFT_1439928 [Lactarius hengduanensis]KAH9032304.1 hypothetical protein EDB84DRAFT_1438638 [Lactarius hengduanensis]
MTDSKPTASPSSTPSSSYSNSTASHIYYSTCCWATLLLSWLNYVLGLTVSTSYGGDKWTFGLQGACATCSHGTARHARCQSPLLESSDDSVGDGDCNDDVFGNAIPAPSPLHPVAQEQVVDHTARLDYFPGPWVPVLSER